MSVPRSSRRSTDLPPAPRPNGYNARSRDGVQLARRRDRMVEMVALLEWPLPSGQRLQTRAEVGEFYTVADTVRWRRCCVATPASSADARRRRCRPRTLTEAAVVSSSWDT